VAEPGECGRWWAAELEALAQRHQLRLPSHTLPLFYGAGVDRFAPTNVFSISLAALAQQ